MPRKVSPKKPEQKSELPPYLPSPDAQWGGFVNFKLTDEHKEAFTRFLEDYETQMSAYIGDVLSLGVSLSVKWVPDSQAFCASLTTKPLPDIDMRCCQTSWAQDPLTALAMAVYKWDVLAQRNWGSYNVGLQRFENWG